MDKYIYMSTYTWVYLQIKHLDIFNYTCFYIWEYLQLYENLYEHRNNVIVQLYEYLYLGILSIIRVVILVIQS